MRTSGRITSAKGYKIFVTSDKGWVLIWYLHHGALQQFDKKQSFLRPAKPRSEVITHGVSLCSPPRHQNLGGEAAETAAAGPRAGPHHGPHGVFINFHLKTLGHCHDCGRRHTALNHLHPELRSRTHVFFLCCESKLRTLWHFYEEYYWKT